MKELYIDSYLPKALNSEENLLYFQKMKENPQIRDTIIIGNLRLVASRIFKKFSNLENETEELFSVGVIGLIKAVDSFDLTKKISFSSYASTCIDNEILMFLRKRKRYINVQSIEDEIEDTEIPFIHTIEDENIHFVEDYEDTEILILLKQLIDKLPFREKTVMLCFFGFGCEPMGENAIATQLNISRSYVSKILHKGLNILKTNLEQERIDKKIKR